MDVRWTKNHIIFDGKAYPVREIVRLGYDIPEGVGKIRTDGSSLLVRPLEDGEISSELAYQSDGKNQVKPTQATTSAISIIISNAQKIEDDIAAHLAAQEAEDLLIAQGLPVPFTLEKLIEKLIEKKLLTQDDIV